MSMARPAAEIDPQAWIFASSWMLPGPIRPSVSRSIRTLSEGSGWALDFCMAGGPVSRGVRLPLRPFANKVNRLHNHINTDFRGRHEFSSFVFTAADRSLPAAASRRDGALDPDAGGTIELRAEGAERRILPSARHPGWLDYRRGLAGHGDRTRQCGNPGHLFGTADQGLAGCRRCRARQGRADLSPALACRAGVAFLVPARRRAAGGAVGGADSGPLDHDRARPARAL